MTDNPTYIKKVRPRIEWRKRRPRLVRYEGQWYNSGYGMFWVTAATHKRAVRAMKIGIADMMAGP